MYVDPEHRRRGLAKRLMAMARAEAEALELDYVTLHATEDGRPLYQALGWIPSAEMGLHLKPPIAINRRTAKTA